MPGLRRLGGGPTPTTDTPGEIGSTVVVSTIYGEVIEATFLGLEPVDDVNVKHFGLRPGAVGYRFTRTDGKSSAAGFLRYPHEVTALTPVADPGPLTSDDDNFGGA